MPALSLQVVSIDAVPVGQPALHAFEVSGGSIGRDETNFLPLPDKHRRVSRLHATISFPGGMPTITNSSTSLPLSVGEQQLDSGESMPITHGSLIEIGPYILQAHIGAASQTAAAAQVSAPARHDLLPTVMPGVAPDAQQLPPSVPDHRSIDVLKPWSSVPSATPNEPLMSPQAASSPASWAPQIGEDFAALGVAAAPTTARPSDSVAFDGTSWGAAQADGAPYAPGNVDPFADLLAGIGEPSRTPVHSTPGGSPAPIRPIDHVGISEDPLASFGGALSGTTDILTGQSTGRSGASGLNAREKIDDFNPFHLPSSSGRNTADPLAGLIGTSMPSAQSAPGAMIAPPSIDSLFQSSGSHSNGGLLVGFGADERVGNGSIESLIRSDAASDPLSLFDATVPQPPASARPVRDDSLEVGSAFSPPLASVAAPAVASPSRVHVHAGEPLQGIAPFASPPPVRPLPAPMQVPNTSTSALSASPDALTEAFLRGAGLSTGALPNGLTPEIMAIVGSLLRSATAGAVDMLAARAATKREVQASVTIISVQANNPLKFLPNADAALLQLLGKKMPGFMRADVAMRDAFDDLRAHEVGVIAGTRAALTEVLGKFDPAVLGDKLSKGSVLESLMPSARKAKLWDMYLERYLQIRREAEDDFQSIFGRAFVQAYERETSRIKGESSMSGGE